LATLSTATGKEVFGSVLVSPALLIPPNKQTNKQTLVQLGYPIFIQYIITWASFDVSSLKQNFSKAIHGRESANVSSFLYDPAPPSLWHPAYVLDSPTEKDEVCIGFHRFSFIFHA
jgi:hypothetical protein